VLCFVQFEVTVGFVRICTNVSGLNVAHRIIATGIWLIGSLRNSREMNNGTTLEGLDQRSKMEVEPRMCDREAQMQKCRGDEKKPADCVHKRCYKYYPSALSCKGKRIRHDCGHGDQGRKFTAGRVKNFEKSFVSKTYNHGDFDFAMAWNYQFLPDDSSLRSSKNTIFHLQAVAYRWQPNQ